MAVCRKVIGLGMLEMRARLLLLSIALAQLLRSIGRMTAGGRPVCDDKDAKIRLVVRSSVGASSYSSSMRSSVGASSLVMRSNAGALSSSRRLTSSCSSRRLVVGAPVL